MIKKLLTKKEQLTDLESKRVSIINVICLISIFFSVVFCVIDMIQGEWLIFFGTLALLVLMTFVLFVNLKGFYKISRSLTLVVSFLYIFFSSNFLFTGHLSEYFYLLILLGAMILFDNTIVQLVALSILVAAFYIPNLYFNHYPEGVFGYANNSALFLGIFFTIRYFVNLNKKNEQLLLEDNNTILSQKEKLSELKEFKEQYFTNISHEIRTPLTIVKGHVSGLPKENRQVKESIYEQIDQITSLLNDVMDLAKIDSNQLHLDIKPQNLTHLLTRQFFLFEEIFKQKGLELEIDLPQDDLYIDVDKTYFYKCISNLLVNSLKYTSEGNVIIQLINVGEKVEISVIDTGIGVSEEEQKDIFNKFSRASNTGNIEGSGVGLAFVSNCVKLMKGEVSLESKLGSGSFFKLCFNKSESSEINEYDDLPFENGTKDKIKILLVEDNRNMAQYIKTIFQDHSLDVVYDGLNALKAIENNKYDCIISDFNLPNKNGKELLIDLNSRGSKTPFIVLTSLVDEALKIEMLELGAVDYLTKPFSENELKLKVEKITSFKPQIKPIEISQSRPEILNELDEYLNTNQDEIKISEMANDFNMSESTFLRTVKQQSNLTPKQYVKLFFLSKAKEALDNNPDITLKELTLIARVKNQTYFKLEFEKSFGIQIK